MSDHTTGSKRCCNRRGCPYYQRTHRHVGTTPYVSANEGTSTQFLYFGPNFVGSPSGEIREFQDCLSEADVPIVAVPSLARSLQQAASVLGRTDSGNYEVMLQQIITLSNRLLNHMAKTDPRYMRHDMRGNGMGGMGMAGATHGISGSGGTPAIGGPMPTRDETDRYVTTDRMGGTTPVSGGVSAGTGGTGEISARMGGMGEISAGSGRTGGQPATPALSGTPEMGGPPSIDGTGTLSRYQNATPDLGTVGRFGEVGRENEGSNLGPRHSLQIQHIPIDLRMLRIEPVHLTIPFTLHFQTTAPPPSAEDQRPLVLPSASIQPIRAAQMSTPAQPYTAEDQRPLVLPSASVEPIRMAQMSTPAQPYTAEDQRPLVLPSASIEPIRMAQMSTPAQPYTAEDQRPLVLPSASIDPIRTAQMSTPAQPYTAPLAYTPPPPPPQQPYIPPETLQPYMPPPPPPQPYVAQQPSYTAHEPLYTVQQKPYAALMYPLPAYVPPPQQTYGTGQPYSVSSTVPSITHADQEPGQLTFPYTPDEQANMFVSQGKFPPITGQSSSYGNLEVQRPKDDPLPSHMSHEPPFLQQPWTYPQSEQPPKEMKDHSSDLAESSGHSGVIMEADKAVQTDKPSKLQKQPLPPPPPPPLDLETEAAEKRSQADSHRDHSYIIPTAESESESPSRPNELFDQVKLYKTDFTLEDELSAITRTTTDRWAGGAMEGSEENEPSQPPGTVEIATSTRRSRTKEEKIARCEQKRCQAQLEQLEREQAMYEQSLQHARCEQKRCQAKLEELEREQAMYETPPQPAISEQKRCQAKLEELEKEQAIYEKSPQNAVCEQKRCQAKLEELEIEQAMYEKSPQHARCEQKRYQAKLEELEREQAMYEKSLQHARCEQKRCQAKLEELEREQSMYEKSLQHARCERKQCQAKLEELEREPAMYEKSLQHARCEQKRCQAKLEELEKEQAMYEKLLQRARCRQKRCQAKLEELEKEQENREKPTQNASCEQKQSQAKLEELQKEQAMHEKSLQRVRCEQKRCQTKLEELEREQAMYEKSLQHARCELKRCQAKLEELQREQAMYENSLQHARCGQKLCQAKLEEFEREQAMYEKLLQHARCEQKRCQAKLEELEREQAMYEKPPQHAICEQKRCQAKLEELEKEQALYEKPPQHGRCEQKRCQSKLEEIEREQAMYEKSLQHARCEQKRCQAKLEELEREQAMYEKPPQHAICEQKRCQAKLEELEREQAMYEKPPQPVDASNTPFKIPDSMSYPSQYGRSTTTPPPHQQRFVADAPQMINVCTGTSFTSYPPQPSDNQIQPSICSPECYKCMQKHKRRKSHCRKRRNRSAESSKSSKQSSSTHLPPETNVCTGTSFTSYPPRPSDNQIQSSICGPECCCCKCLHKHNRRKSRSRKRRNRSSDSSKSSKRSMRFGDEDYFSAESDTDGERKTHRLKPKKAKSNIRKKPCRRSVSVVQVGANLSPEQCMMLKVMEQMMKILSHMDAAQRCIKSDGEESSVKTLYQSSRTEGMCEQSKSTLGPIEFACAREDEDEKSAGIVSPDCGLAGELGGELGEGEDIGDRPSLKSLKSCRGRKVSLKENYGEVARDEAQDEHPEEDIMMPYSREQSSVRPSRRSSRVAGTVGDGVCNPPVLVITFDRETGMPVCCVHSGQVPGQCQSIPVFEIQPCPASGGVSAHISTRISNTQNGQHEPYICDDNEAVGEESRFKHDTMLNSSEEFVCEEEGTTRFEVRIHDQVQIIQKAGSYGADCNEAGGVVDITMQRVGFSTVHMECDEECHAVCEATQTDECMAAFLATKTGQEIVCRSADMMEEIRGYGEDDEEYCEYEEEVIEESCHSTRSERKSKEKIRTSQQQVKSRSGGDIRNGECDCCHCRSEREKQQSIDTAPRPGSLSNMNTEECKNQLKSIVDSIIADLECMEKVRKRMGDQVYQDEVVPKSPPQHARQSFPVTIMEVCELGLSSLYVKWVIHDCFGIGGYEIYVDGYLTNRYYNARHEAAVVCDVDVTLPHKVCLIAKPKAEKALLGAGDLLDEDCRPPATPPTWTPSVFLYQPTPNMDYCKRFR